MIWSVRLSLFGFLKILNRLVDFFDDQKNILANLLTVFAIAVAARFLLIFLGQTYAEPRQFELEWLAISISQFGVYGNAFDYESGPTAHFAPIYPLLLAGLYKVFGVDEIGELSRQIVNTIFIAIHYALLPILARILFLPISVGVVAGLLGAFVPFHFLSEIRGQESALAAFALVGLCVISLKYLLFTEPGKARPILIGACWGLGVLVSPSVLPILAGFFVWRLMRNYSANLFTVGREAVVVGIVFLVVLSPWAMRNHVQLGEFVWTRSSFGVELNVSNNSRAAAAWFENDQGRNEGGHPWESREELVLYKQLGEIEYNRIKLSSAIEWIHGNLSSFLSLGIKRAIYFWFPKMERRIQSLLLWLVTLVAVAGLLQLARARHPSTAFFLSIWITFPVVYYLMQFVGRYRVMIFWSLLMVSAVVVRSVLKRSLQSATS